MSNLPNARYPPNLLACLQFLLATSFLLATLNASFARADPAFLLSALLRDQHSSALSLTRFTTLTSPAGTTVLSAGFRSSPPIQIITLKGSLTGVLSLGGLSNEVAALRTPPLLAGARFVSATYAVDTLNGSQTSSPVIPTVTPVLPVMTVVTTTANPTFGSSANFSVSLLAAGTPALPILPLSLSTELNQTSDFMGDSVVAWWSMPVHNDGLPGDTAASMLTRFSSQVLDHGYERVILLAGTNDILRTDNDAATTLASIKAMADIASSAGISVILCTVPDISQNGVDVSARVLALNIAITDFANTNHHVLVDFHAALAGHPEWFNDGVHPSPDGHNVMESALARTLLIPSGSVTLSDGTSAPLSATGTATLATNSLPTGVQTVTATFSGDANFLPTSASTVLSVSQAPTSVSLRMLSLSSRAEGPMLLTAIVIHSATVAASGSITFFDGGIPIGSASLTLDDTANFTTEVLSSSVHLFTAAYAGNINLAPSRSPSADAAVHSLSTVVSITSTSTRFFAGDPVAIMANVATDAVGTLRLLEGTQILLQLPMSGGRASFALSTLSVGTHELTVSYSGDSFYAAAQSPVLSVSIAPVFTEALLSPMPAVMFYGTLATIKATMVPATTTGNVLFQDTLSTQSKTVAQTLGQSTLNNGVAVLDATSLAPGTHTINVIYSGDDTHLSARSSPVSIRVDPSTSVTALASAASDIFFGALANLAASVYPATATGSVEFLDAHHGTLARIPLSNGSATFSTATLIPGLHAISALYEGDDLHAPSESQTVVTEVHAGTTSITLAPPQGTVNVGSLLSLTAVVSPVFATGSVIFRDSAAGLLGDVPLTNGIARLLLDALPSGKYSIDASYTGNGFYTPSSAIPVYLEVVLKPTVTTLAHIANLGTSGAPISLTALVTSAQAGGVVNFFDTVSGPLGSAFLANGTATFLCPALAGGLHVISASFSGDNLNASSTSPPILLTIAANHSATNVSLAQNTAIAGESVIFNVRVNSTCAAVPTGTFLLRSGATILGSVALANAIAGAGYGSLLIDSAALGVGIFPVVATYSGDQNIERSDSSTSPTFFTILPIPTLAHLTLSTTRSIIKGSAILSASVTAPGSGSIPTGTVTFRSDGKVVASVPVDASGNALISFPATSIGTYLLSADYVAKGAFANASTASQAFAVTLPLSLSFDQAHIDVTHDSTRTATLIVTPLSGFSGAISANCVSPAPYIKCTVSAPVSVETGHSISVTVHVAMAHDTSSLYASAVRPFSTALAATLAWFLFPAFTLRQGVRLRSFNLHRSGVLLVLATFLLTLDGCTLGGNFFDLPAGPQAIRVEVTGGGTTVTTNLWVNISPKATNKPATATRYN